MGQYPSTIIISEDVFKRDECPKNFEAYVKQSYLGGEGIMIRGKRFFIISWCEHYDQGVWDELEPALDDNDDVVPELTNIPLEYVSPEEIKEDKEENTLFPYRVSTWLDMLHKLHQELVF